MFIPLVCVLVLLGLGVPNSSCRSLLCIRIVRCRLGIGLLVCVGAGLVWVVVAGIVERDRALIFPLDKGNKFTITTLWIMIYVDTISIFSLVVIHVF